MDFSQSDVNGQTATLDPCLERRSYADLGGAGNRTRTYDPRITNALLYQLSYPGAVSERRGFYIFLRSRMTRSMPTTSVPGGGGGRRLNSTAGTGTSMSAPVVRSWKW
jgi:hypothetical protein